MTELCCMSNSSMSGEPGTVLVEATDSRRAISARLQRNEGNCYELRLASPVAEPEHPVMVSLGVGREQRFASVSKSSQDGHVLTVWTAADWYRTADRRREVRYPVWVPCLLRAEKVAALARCLDLSLSGAAIEAASWDSPVFTLEIGPRGQAISIPCRAASFQPCGAMTIIHSEFVDTPELSKPALAELVDSARDDFLEAQRFLVERANDASSALR